MNQEAFGGSRTVQSGTAGSVRYAEAMVGGQSLLGAGRALRVLPPGPAFQPDPPTLANRALFAGAVVGVCLGMVFVTLLLFVPH